MFLKLTIVVNQFPLGIKWSVVPLPCYVLYFSLSKAKADQRHRQTDKQSQTESQEHIYSCENLNEYKIKVEFKRIFEENVKVQKQILEKFKENLEKRRNSNPLDPSGRSTVAKILSCNSNG